MLPVKLFIKDYANKVLQAEKQIEKKNESRGWGSGSVAETLATNSDDLNTIPGTSMVNERTNSTQLYSGFLVHYVAYTCAANTHTHTQMSEWNFKIILND